jgi:hypothetical protein
MKLFVIQFDHSYVCISKVNFFLCLSMGREVGLRANLDVVTKKKSQTTTGNQTRSFKRGQLIF